MGMSAVGAGRPQRPDQHQEPADARPPEHERQRPYPAHVRVLAIPRNHCRSDVEQETEEEEEGQGEAHGGIVVLARGKGGSRGGNEGKHQTAGARSTDAAAHSGPALSANRGSVFCAIVRHAATKPDGAPTHKAGAASFASRVTKVPMLHA